MCDPATAIAAGGLALSGGSVLANMFGQGDQSSARNDALLRQRNAQQMIQQQSNELFNNTLNQVGADKQNADRDAIAKERTAQDVSRLDSRPMIEPATGSAPQEVGSSIARSIRSALDRGKVQARLNADVSSYGGANQNAGTTLTRAGQWQNIFGTNMMRTAGLLPGELEAANGAGSGWRGVGAIGSALGQAGAAYGLSGQAPKSWGNLFSGAGTSGSAAP